jgi:hypothetical protein
VHLNRAEHVHREHGRGSSTHFRAPSNCKPVVRGWQAAPPRMAP